MDIFSKEIIIPITAAILGIAVPLLIGVIQRIDDKYESTRLIQLFMNERSTKHFLGLLAITIFLLFYQLVAPPNYFDFGVLTKYIDYSRDNILCTANIQYIYDFQAYLYL